MDSDRLADDLRVAAEQLRQSLARRTNDSDVWLQYLNPDMVIDSLDVTKQAEPAGQRMLIELLGHYDGVAENPELRNVSMTPGFDRTRKLLRVWVDRQPVDTSADQTIESPTQAEPPLEPSSDASSREVMPLPVPDAAADSAAEPEPTTQRSL
jgi:hypothetical protein